MTPSDALREILAVVEEADVDYTPGSPDTTYGHRKQLVAALVEIRRLANLVSPSHAL